MTQQPTEIKMRTRKVKPTWFLNSQSRWWRAQIDGKSSSWLSSSLLTFHGRFDWLESILFDWFCEDFGEFVELLIGVAMKIELIITGQSNFILFFSDCQKMLAVKYNFSYQTISRSYNSLSFLWIWYKCIFYQISKNDFCYHLDDNWQKPFLSSTTVWY